MFNVDSLYGFSIAWPAIHSAGLQQTPAGKMAILGGHVGLMGVEIAVEQCECSAHRASPSGVVCRISWAGQNHFRSNLSPASVLGRACGHPPVTSARIFYTELMGHVCGKDRTPAAFSGIAPGDRMRRRIDWDHYGEFTTGRQLPPWIWRTSPEWDDSCADYILFES